MSHGTIRPVAWHATFISHTRWLVGVLLFAAPGVLEAQAVVGQVVEEASDQGIALVRIQLLDAEGQVKGSATSRSSGAFSVLGHEAGAFRVRAERLGYQTVTTDPLELVADSITHVVLRMDPEAVALEPLEVVARRENHLNRATYDGMYQRWAHSPSVGTNRVILPHERELDGAWTVGDFLGFMGVSFPYQNFGASMGRQGSRCVVVVFWGAQQIRDKTWDWQHDLMDTAIGTLEGVELYTNPEFAPLAFRPVMDDPGEVPCAVVVLWPSRGGPSIR